MESKEHTCCFFGHRKIEFKDKMISRIQDIAEELITANKADTFLFGSKSEFDKLCLSAVTKLKEKYPHIRRVYVRAEFPYIDESYTAYLLQSYDDTYYPERIKNSGKATYVERNFEMIDNSNYCIVYYDENYLPERRKRGKKDLSDYQPKSGTKLAFEYAKKKDLHIINVRDAI